jgi:hypothetical protein
MSGDRESAQTAIPEVQRGSFGGWTWTAPEAQPEAEEDDAKLFTKEEKRQLWRFIRPHRCCGSHCCRRNHFNCFRRGFGGHGAPHPCGGFEGPSPGFGWPPHCGFRGSRPCGKNGRKLQEETMDGREDPAEGRGKERKSGGQPHRYGPGRGHEGHWAPPRWGFGGW